MSHACLRVGKPVTIPEVLKCFSGPFFKESMQNHLLPNLPRGDNERILGVLTRFQIRLDRIDQHAMDE